jgi:hypothetical protein
MRRNLVDQPDFVPLYSGSREAYHQEPTRVLEFRFAVKSIVRYFLPQTQNSPDDLSLEVLR